MWKNHFQTHNQPVFQSETGDLGQLDIDKLNFSKRIDSILHLRAKYVFVVVVPSAKELFSTKSLIAGFRLPKDFASPRQLEVCVEIRTKSQHQFDIKSDWTPVRKAILLSSLDSKPNYPSHARLSSDFAKLRRESLQM